MQEHWQILWFTLAVSALSTLINIPAGLSVAWLLARKSWFGKSIVEALIMLPLVMPPVATGFLLLKLLGRRGVIGGIVRRLFDLDIVFTWRGVVAAMAVMSFPLLVRTARAAFEEVPPRLEQVARTLGAGSWRVFATITFPLAVRGIAAGILLSYARAIGEFGATIVVAGNIPRKTTTLSLAIYYSIQLGHDAEAYWFMFIALTIAFASVLVSEIFLRRTRKRTT